MPSSVEEQKVHGWRFDEAQRLGLSFTNAHLFAASGADLRHLRKLVADGCPVDIMLRILL